MEKIKCILRYIFLLTITVLLRCLRSHIHHGHHDLLLCELHLVACWDPALCLLWKEISLCVSINLLSLSNVLVDYCLSNWNTLALGRCGYKEAPGPYDAVWMLRIPVVSISCFCGLRPYNMDNSEAWLKYEGCKCNPGVCLHAQC